MAWNMNLATAQTDEAGNVALLYYQTVNPFIQVSGREYKFTTRQNICLAWVTREDGQKLLDRLGGCCGGKKPVFRVASEDDVRRWTYGGR